MLHIYHCSTSTPTLTSEDDVKSLAACMAAPEPLDHEKNSSTPRVQNLERLTIWYDRLVKRRKSMDGGQSPNLDT